MPPQVGQHCIRRIFNELTTLMHFGTEMDAVDSELKWAKFKVSVE